MVGSNYRVAIENYIHKQRLEFEKDEPEKIN